MTEWLATHVVDGVVQFRIGTDGTDNLIAEWIGVARLIARRSGVLVRFEVESNADPRTVAKIERGGVRMLLRHLRGGLSVHGAAIELEGRAALLVGASGMGKSTLAAWFVEHARARLLSDDLTPLERNPNGLWSAVPLESDHWLDAAAVAAVSGAATLNQGYGKMPRATRRFADAAAPIAVIVELAFDTMDVVEVSRMSPVEGLGLLLRNSVRFEIDNPASQTRELEDLAALSESLPFIRITRPRSFGALQQTHERIARWFRNGIVGAP